MKKNNLNTFSAQIFQPNKQTEFRLVRNAVFVIIFYVFFFQF